MAINSGVESRPDLNIVPKFSDTGSLNKAEIGYTPVKISESDTKDIFNRPLTDGKFSTDYTFLDLSQTSILGTAFTKDAQYSLSGYSACNVSPIKLLIVLMIKLSILIVIERSMAL